jgi:hypothetical protein
MKRSIFFDGTLSLCANEAKRYAVAGSASAQPRLPN